MFGRIRSPPSTVELLELERLPSKLFKDDSLSIYESTLAKLKQGSQRNLSQETQVSMDFEAKSTASEDSHKGSRLCSEQGLPACSTDSSCSGVSSSPDQEQKIGREISIRYLFSKYTTSNKKESSTSYNGGSSVNMSACSSESESSGCSRL
ncbi:hypothetical protein SOVF_153180 [Spinacia oleracea]|uniref:Uncharacterized protein n=1 Tax=Spinacia oleracea TaxID=3562 RepID=A0A9R0JHC0_SPIOL|nr:uncharacterized protein LOC110774842 [Spinacia oleracea]KNA09468.1 hypothetical protein SOVF_153180 [Spinacia oleracea]